MPFILLFLLLLAGTAAYMYFSRNQGRYTHKKEKPADPKKVIYLPGDIQSDNTDNDSNEP